MEDSNLNAPVVMPNRSGRPSGKRKKGAMDAVKKAAAKKQKKNQQQGDGSSSSAQPE